MNTEAEQLLQQLLTKDINDLTADDIAFLRARESYLTHADKQALKDILKGKPAKLSYKELQARAKELGINSSGVKQEELERLITEAEKPETAENPYQ